MPSEYSYVHGQPGYWKVRFDDWNGWEAPHIHAMQGDRELQVYTKTLEIKNQTGKFSSDEIEEIKNIARNYTSNYCITIDNEMFNANNTEKLMELKRVLLSLTETKKHVR